MTSEGAKNWPGQTTPAPIKILVVVAFFAVLHAGVLPAAASDDDPWAKLEDSPSMTCLDNEAELNRIWIDNGDLYWSDYGNVSAICRQMNSGDAELADGNECVVSRRDSSSQQWYFKIAIKDSSSSMKVENFFDFDIGQWDLITEVYGFQERATLPCW